MDYNVPSEIQVFKNVKVKHVKHFLVLTITCTNNKQVLQVTENSQNPRLRTSFSVKYLLPIRRPLYKKLFSLKFETGSYFLKSLYIKFSTLGQIRYGSSLETELPCNSNYNNIVMVERFCLRNELNTTKYSELQCIFFFKK